MADTQDVKQNDFEFQKIERLQKNLLLLRTIAGWKADEFAEKIGVSRQYYSELENGSNNRKLTKSVYLAIRYIYEHEQNEDVQQVLKNCIDDNIVNIDQCKKISSIISSERKRKTNEDDLKKQIYKALGVSSVIGLLGTIIVKALIKK